MPPTIAPPLAVHPVVTLTRDPDTGDAYAVRLGAYRGAERTARHTAEADADALAAALAGPLGVAARVAALLASPEARDAVAGRCAAPASAALAVLRWCSEGPPPDGEGEALQWGDAPVGGMAVVTGGEDE